MSVRGEQDVREMVHLFKDRTAGLNPHSQTLENWDRSSVPRKGSFHPGILVGDEDLWNRAVLWAALTKQGFRVFLATDGEEALEVYGLYQNAINLVLLDVQLPRLDGPESLKVLRDFAPLVACCFMSRELWEHTREDLEALTALPFFDKPLRVVEMVEVLWQVAQGLSLLGNEPHRYQNLSIRSQWA